MADCQAFATHLERNHAGPIDSWDSVMPKEAEDAREKLNAQLSRQNIVRVTSEVFRHRMLQAFRDQKKCAKRIIGRTRSSGQQGSCLCSTGAGQGSHTPNESVPTLPSINAMLEGGGKSPKPADHSEQRIRRASQ